MVVEDKVVPDIPAGDMVGVGKAVDAVVALLEEGMVEEHIVGVASVEEGIVEEEACVEEEASVEEGIVEEGASVEAPVEVPVAGHVVVEFVLEQE
jgi:hypothetical protein